MCPEDDGMRDEYDLTPEQIRAAERGKYAARFTEESESTPTGALSVLERLAGTVNAPADWASEHDHYLYGTPKRADRE